MLDTLDQEQLFQVVRIDAQMGTLLEKISDIQWGCLNFHVFLQGWAMVLDKRK